MGASADRVMEGRPPYQAFQKEDLSSCSIYRGITLLPIPEVCNRILLNRMEDAIDPVLRDEQASFCKDGSYSS